MAEEDFFCSGCREGLSSDYSDLVKASRKNSYLVHQYHKDFRDFLKAVENQCFLCTTVGRSLSAESQATCLQGNTSTQKAWGQKDFYMILCDDQPPSLTVDIIIRNMEGAGPVVNSFRIIPFTGILSQSLLSTARSAPSLQFLVGVAYIR